MGTEYTKILKDLDVKLEIIGRGKRTASILSKETAIKPFVGGLSNFLKRSPDSCSHAIVAVSVEELADTATMLLNYGIKNILVEKPGPITKEKTKILLNKTIEKNANVFIAYNRRFYASTIKAKNIIEKDGGVKSFNFEFTEWTKEVESLKKNSQVLKKWFLANSTHVADLAFYLGGKPKEISTFTRGGLSWHPSASIFSGSGISVNGALFSYNANWESAGRWGLEVLTRKNKLIFEPLEKLQIQKPETTNTYFDKEIDYSLDTKYKPGLFVQTKNFINSSFENMININEHHSMFDLYEKIANY
jgi:predicted dehydrogenase